MLKIGRMRFFSFLVFTAVNTDQGTTSSRADRLGKGLLAPCTPGPCPIGKSRPGAADGAAAAADFALPGAGCEPRGDDSVCACKPAAARKSPQASAPQHATAPAPRNAVREVDKPVSGWAFMGCS